jgi:hypothetical protein
VIANTQSAVKQLVAVTIALPDADDILHAARHRLRDWTPEQVFAGLQRIESIADTKSYRRDPHSAACALLALAAEATGDMAALYRAGIGLMAWYRQVKGGKGKAGKGDALHDLIVTHYPETDSSDIWKDIARLVADRRFDEVLVDFVDDTLSYVPAPRAKIKDIGYDAFRRRVQRVRESMKNGQIAQHQSMTARNLNRGYQFHASAAD